MIYDQMYFVVAKDIPEYPYIRNQALDCGFTESTIKSPDTSYSLFSSLKYSFHQKQAINQLLLSIANIRHELVIIDDGEIFKEAKSEDRYGCDEEFGNILETKIEVTSAFEAEN